MCSRPSLLEAAAARVRPPRVQLHHRIRASTGSDSTGRIALLQLVRGDYGRLATLAPADDQAMRICIGRCLSGAGTTELRGESQVSLSVPPRGVGAKAPQ